MFITLDAFDGVLTQYLRGAGKMRLFAATGIIHAVFLLAANIAFLIILKLHLFGWILSFLIAKLALTLILLFMTKANHVLALRNIDKTYIFEMLKYCLPLIPNTAMWWIMNTADRYMLTLFISTAATGLYAVANKIPSILSIFENTFYQAWQTSSINMKRERNRDAFYADVFTKYLLIMCLCSICVLAIGKEAIFFLFSDDFSSAWPALAPLIVAVFIHALAGNLGTVYVTFKATKGALITSAFGAAVNILLNAFFIPNFGITGAAITTFLGYCVVLVLRWYDIKHYINLMINKRRVAPILLLLAAQVALFYLPSDWWISLRLVIALIAICFERDLLLSFVNRGKT